MKKLCIVSDESVLAGSANTGVGEVVDSLAASLAREYEVYVVTAFGGGALAGYTTGEDSENVVRRRMFGTEYCMIREPTVEAFAEAVREIRPDVLHNFADTGLIRHVRGGRSIYTIDDGRCIRRPDELFLYDAVTTVSKGYAKELLSGRDALADVLRRVDFRGVTNGILSEVFCPEQKVQTAAAFSAEDQAGKDVCKARLAAQYGIERDRVIFAMLCRMTAHKGVNDVLDALPLIHELGGTVLFYGRGMDDPGIPGGVWVTAATHPLRAIPILAGADFLLSPSRYEPCGLMPMSAARYGTIPITTRVGGLRDNMTDDVSIDCSDGLEKAIRTAFDIYADKDRLTRFRAACMRADFGWDRRKRGYVELYEASGDNR